ncbi:MAG: nucleotide exchange factor GrpE [bacterium]|nr:nucleotide exchange factor GrpE [bacterium]
MKDEKTATTEDTETKKKTQKVRCEECEGECLEFEEKLEECENRYKRALADYQNLQKRTVEEKLHWIRNANEELISKLLPVLDTLMLANKHVDDQGLKLSIQQFLDVLKAEDVTKIETKDKEFNPEVMECVEVKKGNEGKVLDEVRAGYKLNDKVLKPAQVVVGKEDPNEKEEELVKEELSKGDYM